MGVFTNRLRTSLALRVLLSTIVLSSAVIWLSGSILDSRVSAGVKQVNLDSAINEARSTIVGARYRLILAKSGSPKEIDTLINEIVSSATTVGARASGRELVLLRGRLVNPVEKDFTTTSNLVDPASLPKEFREKVRRTSELNWSYITIQYAGSLKVPAIAVGDMVSIPRSGRYEMYLLFPLTNQNKTLTLISRSIILVDIALVFLIGLITWLVARQVVRPVREAARVAEQFTSGELNQRMQVTRKDEIATLGISFNEMADSIQQQITRLENLSRVQQRFVSDVSHELRTPLTTLRMASEVIYSSRSSFDPQIARSAELLVGNIDRFERLLEDLLEVSRFDAEVAVLEPVDFNLIALINRCIEDLDLVAKENGTQIIFKPYSEDLIINADARRVERILRNLLNNAVDHADSKPIHIHLEYNENDVAVAVRDHGIGIDENSLLRVFDRFWRADPSRSRIRGGTGLGLSIALEDARLHNGELEVWGRPGHGAHFVLTLPRTAGNYIESRLIRLEPKDYTI
ncbi:BaeS Signal transduction histidine kinase [Candidatus Nanopelagicaceae bacterium]